MQVRSGSSDVPPRPAEPDLDMASRSCLCSATFPISALNESRSPDSSNERMQKRIRDAQLQKIPYMLVVGEREAAEGKVAVRLRSGKDLGAVPLETFVARIKNEAESRRDVAE